MIIITNNISTDATRRRGKNSLHNNTLYHSQEMRDLMKAYNHELKLYHFLAAKGVTRINKRQELKEEQDKIKEEEKSLEQYKYHIKILEEIFVSHILFFS